jgi:sporulation protein YlmC with PRC-barrel domain
MRTDTITGTDVRNPQDEYFGSVEDVVFDQRSGEIAYVIIGRGGFLGMGQEHVAVPWQRMRATPNLDTFVLNMREEQFESAPTINPNNFATDEGYTTQRGEIDRFWDADRAG